MTYFIGIVVTGILIVVSWIFGGREGRRRNDEIEKEWNAQQATIRAAVEKTAKAQAEKQRTIDVNYPALKDGACGCTRTILRRHRAPR